MPDPSDTISHLWTAARAMFARLGAAVGEAVSIAVKEVLSARERGAIRAWLRPLEHMVRKVILIEALALARDAPSAAAPPPRSQAAGKPRAERTTSLRLWPRQRASEGPRVRDLGAPVLVRSIWREADRLTRARHLNKVRFLRAPLQERLARRIDALHRVLDSPFAAARRLARKLRILPRLALELACKPPPRTKLYTEREYSETSILVFAEARGFLSNTS
jgi:hypothetical protein